MYSQNNEEQIINDNLPDNGFLLDFGAWDGKTFSNSLRLIERGWRGVLVEASPINFKPLLELHNDNEGITLVNSPVTVNGGVIPFYESFGDGISTINTSSKEVWERNPNVKFRKIYLTSLTLIDVYNIHKTSFDFVNIDVEGENINLLKTFPFHLTVPKLICIEHDNLDAEIMKVVSEYGYKVLDRNPENLILKRS